MPRYDFLLDTYDTERLKTLSVWSQFRDEDLSFRPEPRARTPLEQQMNRTGTILLAVFSLTAFACSAGREAAPGRAVPVAAAPAEVAPVGVDLTREDMAEIKAAAIRYCEEKKPEIWEVCVAELRRGAIFMKEEIPGNSWPQIGIWKIEQDHGIALVRWSAESLALFPGLTLAQEEGRWIVTGDFVREEFLMPED